MTKTSDTAIERQSPWLPAAVIALTLLVLGIALVLVGTRLRDRLRAQILARDAEVINAVALLKTAVDESGLDQTEEVRDPLDQLAGIIEVSQRRDALVVRLFDSGGRFITAVPLSATEAELSLTDLTRIRSGKPFSRYLGETALAEQLLETQGEERAALPSRLPLAEVLIPIAGSHSNELLGVAQVILDARHLRYEYITLDRSLLRHGGIVFLVCGALVAAMLGWTFGRLEKTRRMLSERTVRLLRANHELALAAKTSALGNVTAHLIHGLKNPLSGLQNFVSIARQQPDGLETEDVQEAAAAASRMQGMIQDIVRVLHEEQTASRYEITCAELFEILQARMAEPATQAKVVLNTRISASGQFDNRDANLVLLILENLVQNAIQASPPGSEVILEASEDDSGVTFEVRDQGPGIPLRVQETLFQPMKSTRAGGNGLGLALSHQIALQLPAELALRHSGADGCVFALHLSHRLVEIPAASISSSKRTA